MSSRARKALTGARIAAGFGLLGGAAVIAAPPLPTASAVAAATTPPAPPAPTLLGAPLEEGEPAEALAASIAERYLSETITLRAGDVASLARSRRALGAEVDVEALARRIGEARDPASSLHRLRDAYDLEGPIRLEMPARLAPEAALEALVALKKEVDHDPRDASYDLEARRVVPEQEGRVLDAWATLDRLAAVLRDGTTEIEIALRRTAPRRTATDLEALHPDARLGEFETRYSLTDAAADRTHNLKVAASRIDGTVLLPGEVFDFNEVVGQRSQANGFHNATVIAGGELAEDVGGGACQVSGTLHAAALFAGLEILERSPHSRPSTYIKLGLDAMVNYPTQNFRFRNDLPFPVLLHFTVEGGVARAEILGTERRRMATFVRRVDGFSAYEEIEREDPSLPAGVRVLDQRGVAGFRVTRFVVVRDPERNQAIRRRSRDVYPPTTQIWRVGTGGAAPEGYAPPEGDRHPEYRADAYVTMTQGPGVEGTVESKRAGATGVVGWTATAGMPQVEAADDAP
jgi:vancomycin resistance protein YoaR